MSLKKPYHRNYRAIEQSNNSGYSEWAYIRDSDYAKTPIHYIRAFKIIQNDLEKLFEYVEPSMESAKSYSYRIHELLMRTCIEVEANFKAILSENLYTPHPNSYLNMHVYKKINVTHHLSSYEINLPIWNGPERIIKPFQSWNNGSNPDWYLAYNESKHDRHEKFKQANLQTLIDAVAGLLVILSSQFRTEEFSAGPDALGIVGHDYYGMNPAIGSLFRIKFPIDWKDEEKYDFDWSELLKQSDRFEKIDYNLI